MSYSPEHNASSVASSVNDLPTNHQTHKSTSPNEKTSDCDNSEEYADSVENLEKETPENLRTTKPLCPKPSQRQPDDAYSMYPDQGALDEDMSRVSTQMQEENPAVSESFEVSLEPEDPENIAMHISYVRKCYFTSIVSYTSVVITILSSVWTFAAPIEMARFHVGQEVATLGITLYIVGLGFGPLFLSPISEFYGRKITFIFSLFFVLVFIIVTTFSPTLAGIFIGRFFSGFFGSAFLSVAGGVVSDIFSKQEIGIPMSIYSISPFLGPTIGPLISAAFVHNNEMKYAFITLLGCTALSLFLVVFSFPETYKPVLCCRKAARLRKELQEDRYYAPLEIIRKETRFVDAVVLSSKRPLLLLAKDPMMAVLCVYTGLILGIVYMFFVAFPLIYREKVYHFTAAETACCYLGILVGTLLMTATSPRIQKRYAARVQANNNVSVPEYRFEALFYGSILCPVGLMIFAWTTYPHVHWIGSVIGNAIFGAGAAYIFAGILGYTVDAYRLYAASGMAANSFVRSIMSGVLPLVTRYMYNRMGVNWASFFLSMLCVLMIPVPFLFTKYGALLRSKSPYAWDD
ncbi:hypothetical protein ACO0QE_000434 [Hanseniaspora vineae]